MVDMTEEAKLDGIRKRIDLMVAHVAKYDSLKDVMPQIEQKASVGKSAERADIAIEYLREIISMAFPRSMNTMSPEQIEAMHKRFPRSLVPDKAKQIKGKFGKWNKFSDCIPDDENDILVSDGFIVISVLWCWDGVHTKELDVETIADLTHWMAYPKLPKTKEQT